MNAEKTKTAEFARLFDLFERLASRRSRDLYETSTSATNNSTEDISSIIVPEDFTPVLRNLTTLLVTRTQQDYIRQQGISNRPRRSTVAFGMKPPAVAKFPLRRLYPFTFKLMIHKLYELEEWAAKVKEVVEKSQLEFKPLCDKECEDRSAEGFNGSGSPPVSSGGRRGGTHHTRARSHSMVSTGKAREIVVAPIKRGDAEQDDVRALKKRRVGRCMSMSASLADVLGGAVVWQWGIPESPDRNVQVSTTGKQRALSLADVTNASPLDDAPRMKMKRPHQTTLDIA